MIIYLLLAIPTAYQLIALVACLRFLRRHNSTLRPAEPKPPVSILKPAHSVDPGFEPALKSHLDQTYSEFELLVGARDPAFPLPAFPGPMTPRLVQTTTVAQNGKVGSLIDLVRAAAYDVLVVSDADIQVPPDYLQRVVAPLSDPGVGLVTCLYRAHGKSFPARLEALGVATDFAPSSLVAPMVGVDEFAFGSTLAFRRKDLERIGGFEAIAGYLADDYQLGRRLHGLGLRCMLSEVVVDTGLGENEGGLAGWTGAWKHQLRWARTIRVSRFDGYLGMPVMYATLWATIAIAVGLSVPDASALYAGLGLLAIRLAAAAAALAALRDSDNARLFLLVPLRDLYGVAVWLVALFGQTVEWRGQRLLLDKEGRITPAE